MTGNVSERAGLRSTLRRAGRRIRLARGIAGAVLGALAVHVVLVPWLVLKSVWPIGGSEYVLAVVAATTFGALVGLLVPVPLRQAARTLDRNLDLDERLTAALEFESSTHLPLAAPLVADAAAHARRLSVATAVPLAPPSRPTRGAVAALAVSALLVWLPPLPLVSPASVHAAPDPRPAVETTPAEFHAATSPIPPLRRPPRAPVREPLAVEFRDSPLETDPESLEQSLRLADDRHPFRDLDDRLPSLRVGGAPGSVLPLPADAVSRPDTELSARRYSRAEADAALGELESLWGGARQRDTTRPPPLEVVRERPEEGGPASQPEGGEPVQREPSADDPPETMPLFPDEERLTPQSDRFASLPESTDAATSDVPPWPKHGPGEGIDDDSPRDEEGTGRNAGEPGTGFSVLPPGSIADRIDTEQAPEVELAGLRQDGAHRSFAADSAGQVARGQARRPMQDMRARFTRRAEQTLNEEWVPLDARSHIKRYFQAIQTRR